MKQIESNYVNKGMSKEKLMKKDRPIYENTILINLLSLRISCCSVHKLYRIWPSPNRFYAYRQIYTSVEGERWVIKENYAIQYLLKSNSRFICMFILKMKSSLDDKCCVTENGDGASQPDTHNSL